MIAWYEHLFGGLAILSIIYSPWLLVKIGAWIGGSLVDDQEWYD